MELGISGNSEQEAFQNKEEDHTVKLFKGVVIKLRNITLGTKEVTVTFRILLIVFEMLKFNIWEMRLSHI